MEQKDSFGDTSNLESFITKDMADFWDEYVKKTRVDIKLSNYDTSKPFGEFEQHRFLTVYCQSYEPFFYYGIVSVNTHGDIRVIKYGKCNTWEELDVIRKNNKVDYRFVGVDTGDGPNQEKQRAKCVSFGRWSDFDGQNAPGTN